MQNSSDKMTDGDGLNPSRVAANNQERRHDGREVREEIYVCEHKTNTGEVMGRINSSGSIRIESNVKGLVRCLGMLVLKENTKFFHRNPDLR